MKHAPLQIAIDGPVAAGKGDIAVRLARELNLTYIYTGAMYRAFALACMRKGIDTKDRPAILGLLPRVQIELTSPDSSSPLSYKVLLDGEDVTAHLFDRHVAQCSSDVSVIPQVRQYMVQRQKELAKNKAVVMEGRDIGLRVLPDAQLKIYLTASHEVRAKRRWLQYKEQRIEKDLHEVTHDTMKRDEQDMSRSVDPLRKLPESWVLDTTNLTQDEVVERIKKELQQRNLL